MSSYAPCYLLKITAFLLQLYHEFVCSVLSSEDNSVSFTIVPWVRMIRAISWRKQRFFYSCTMSSYAPCYLLKITVFLLQLYHEFVWSVLSSEENSVSFTVAPWVRMIRAIFWRQQHFFYSCTMSSYDLCYLLKITAFLLQLYHEFVCSVLSS